MASLNALDTKTLSEHRESHRMRTSLLRSLSLCLTLIVGIPVSFALDGEPPSEGVPSPLSVLSVETEIVRPVSSGMSFAGAAIAVDGDLLLIGVPGRANGDPGEVYTYRHDGTEWTLLPASTLMRHGTTAANFGAAVSLSGTVAVVGAPNDDAGNGSAWRFTFDGTSWDAGTQIMAPTPAMTPNRFGTSVAITAEGRIAIGAPDSGMRMTVAGAVAVYESGSGAGTLVVAPGPTASTFDDLFGASVAFDGESLLVGAPQNDESGTDAGAAFAFERSDGFVASVRLRPSPMFRSLLTLSFWKSPPRFPMGALPPNPAEGFVRVDSSTLSQFLEIASAISDGGFAPKPRRGIRSRRFIDALSAGRGAHIRAARSRCAGADPPR
jgi:hypothetical protein